MAARKKRGLAEADAWRAMHLQLIAFTTLPAVDIKQQWFRDLTKQAPQESVQRAHDRYDKGSYNNVDLAISADALRITLTIAPKSAEQPVEVHNDAERIPTLGPFVEARQLLLGLATRWLPTAPLIKRLVFAGKLLQPAESLDAAYRKVKDYLSTTVKISPNASDLFYRINRPRPSKTSVRGLTINRLCTWSVVRAHLMAQAQTPMGEQIPGQMSRAEVFLCTLDLDINTAAEYGRTLAKRKTVEVFLELAALATEASERGDIP